MAKINGDEITSIFNIAEKYFEYYSDHYTQEAGLLEETYPSSNVMGFNRYSTDVTERCVQIEMEPSDVNVANSYREHDFVYGIDNSGPLYRKFIFNIYNKKHEVIYVCDFITSTSIKINFIKSLIFKKITQKCVYDSIKSYVLKTTKERSEYINNFIMKDVDNNCLEGVSQNEVCAIKKIKRGDVIFHYSGVHIEKGNLDAWFEINKQKQCHGFEFSLNNNHIENNEKSCCGMILPVGNNDMSLYIKSNRECLNKKTNVVNVAAMQVNIETSDNNVYPLIFICAISNIAKGSVLCLDYDKKYWGNPFLSNNEEVNTDASRFAHVSMDLNKENPCMNMDNSSRALITSKVLSNFEEPKEVFKPNESNKYKRNIQYMCIYPECFFSESRFAKIVKHFVNTHDSKNCNDYVNYKYEECTPKIKQMKKDSSRLFFAKYVCKICWKVCGATNILGLHMRSHTGIKPFGCIHCNYRAAHKSNLDQHSLIHSNTNGYRCINCGKGFTQRSSLTRHVKSLHKSIKPHKCPYCKNEYACKDRLTNHMRVHTGEKPYSCDICGRPFRRKDYLNNHYKTHQKV